MVLLRKLAVIKLYFGENLMQKKNSALIFPINLTLLRLVFSKEGILFLIYFLADKAKNAQIWESSFGTLFDEINLRDDSTLVSKVSRQIFKTRGKNKQCHGTVALSEFAALDINYHGEYKTKKFNEIFVNIPFCATIPLSSSM